VQFAPEVDADQLNIVLVLVVPEDVSPAGELGVTEQFAEPDTGCHSAGTFGGSHPTSEVCA
jgi:hypothetical protein